MIYFPAYATKTTAEAVRPRSVALPAAAVGFFEKTFKISLNDFAPILTRKILILFSKKPTAAAVTFD